MQSFFKRILGNSNESVVKKLNKAVDAIDVLENEYKALTNVQLQGKTDEFKGRIAKGESLDNILPEAFATVREAAWRILGQRPFRVQLLGGDLTIRYNGETVSLTGDCKKIFDGVVEL